MAMKFHTSVAKGLKLKFRKFLGLILTFLKVRKEKLVGGRRIKAMLKSGGQKAVYVVYVNLIYTV